MSIRRMFPLFLLMSMALTVPACATRQEAAYKTNEVTNQTAGTVDSVLDAVGSAIMCPFHLIGDLFS